MKANRKSEVVSLVKMLEKLPVYHVPLKSHDFCKHCFYVVHVYVNEFLFSLFILQELQQTERKSVEEKVTPSKFLNPEKRFNPRFHVEVSKNEYMYFRSTDKWAIQKIIYRVFFFFFFFFLSFFFFVVQCLIFCSTQSGLFFLPLFLLSPTS